MLTMNAAMSSLLSNVPAARACTEEFDEEGTE